MTRSLPYALLIVLCLSTYISCTDNEYDILLGRIEKINSPDTVYVNQTFKISTTFSGGSNGCATPSHLEFDNADENLLVAAYYKIPRTESACTMAIPIHSITSEHSFSNAGFKTIRDIQGNVSKEIFVIE
jgi:hypothetical protein